MTIAITTPTGKVGRATVSALREAGAKDLLLLARDPSKLDDDVLSEAETAAGSLQDVDYLISATRDVDTLFWVTPADFSWDDMRSEQGKLGENAVRAINENEIPRVVMLSSVGAHQPDGTGPIAGLYDIEKMLRDKTDAEVVALRPGYFFENVFNSLNTISEMGMIFLPVKGDVETEMIATADIGKVAAELLLADEWDEDVIELVGPESLSFDRIASTVGDVLGREVKHVPVTAEQAIQSMMEMGLSKDVASRMAELHAGLTNGKVGLEGQPRRTSTTFGDWARAALPAALQG